MYLLTNAMEQNEMNEAQKLQAEINALTAKRNEVNEANSVECGGPVLKRTFAYRTSPAIKAHDVAAI